MGKENQAGLIAGLISGLIFGVVSSLILFALKAELSTVFTAFAGIVLQGIFIGYLLSIIDKKYRINIEQEALLSSFLIIGLVWIGKSVITNKLIDILNMGTFWNMVIWTGLISYFYRKNIG